MSKSSVKTSQLPAACWSAALLTQLELAPRTEQLLLSGDFSMGSLGAGVDAAWELHHHLEALKVPAATEASKCRVLLLHNSRVEGHVPKIGVQKLASLRMQFLANQCALV